MASDDIRSDVKSSVTHSSDKDPELDDAFSESEKYKLEFLKESNRHKEATQKVDKGNFGVIVGNQSNVASVCAIIFVIAGALGFFYFNSLDPANEKMAERILAVGVSALTFLFGKSQSNKD